MDDLLAACFGVEEIINLMIADDCPQFENQSSSTNIPPKIFVNSDIVQPPFPDGPFQQAWQ